MECEYCLTDGAKLRLLPNAERETVVLCRECWLDVQGIALPATPRWKD
jgi:hypothetical protein